MAGIWRDDMRPVVAEVIDEGRRRGMTGAELVRWASRQHRHPRASWLDRAWCREVKIQLGAARPLGARERAPDLAGQGRLFG